MWVNDSISGGILVSPDSTMFYHIYNNSNPKVLKLFKRDLLTNKVLLEKDFEYSKRRPDMDLSPDGKYIIMVKINCNMADSILIWIN